MTYQIVDPTVCPDGHDDCQEISQVDFDLMPDQCEQGYYCYQCDRTYVVLYQPVTSHWVTPIDGQ